jgi:hypothetical protein
MEGRSWIFCTLARVRVAAHRVRQLKQGEARGDGRTTRARGRRDVVSGGPPVRKPRPGQVRLRWDRMWLEIWTVLTEHGSLIAFAGLVVGLEILRHGLGETSPWSRAVMVAEWITLATMVGPKGIRSGTELLVTLALGIHDVIHSIRHGTRRPPKDPPR